MAKCSCEDDGSSLVVRLAAVFVLFVILTSPAVAGEQARSFFGFLGHAVNQLQIFVGGLVGNPPA